MRIGVTRRGLMAGLAGISATLALRATQGFARADTRTAVSPPRYWLQIVPAGGMDAVWTTDPRTRSGVQTGVDVPYRASEIVDAGMLRLGPAFGSLAPHADHLAIVNGVLVKAANHYTGMEQITRLRTSTTPRTPSCLDVIGAHRDSQALAHAILNPPLREARTPSSFGNAYRNAFGGGGDVFAALDQLQPDELDELGGVVGRQIASLKRRGTLDDKQKRMVDSLGQTRALLEQLVHAPRFAAAPWFSGASLAIDEFIGLSAQLQHGLWLIENDLAATVTVFTNSLLFDTHWGNTELQAPHCRLLGAGLARLFDELRTRSNRHGKLADSTAVVVGSEIGRLPYINQLGGKDHFPQIPLLLSGPGFNPGQFGAVGNELEARATSFKRGVADARGDRMLLDDVGHTALRVAGIDATSYGVWGRNLDFLRVDRS